MRKILWSAFILMTAFTSTVKAGPHSSPIAAISAPSDNPAKVVVSLLFEQHRPYTRLTLTGPSGKTVQALFWLDTGGGAVILSGSLASELGLKATGKAINNGGERIAPTSMPAIRVGSMSLSLKGSSAFLVTSSGANLGETGAQGALPLRALRSYQVVLDYPHARLTIAQPGALRPEGTRMEAHFSESGFISVTTRVNGKPYGFLLDSGGQYCMVSQQALTEWQKQNPNWPHVTGVYGPANMMLGPRETSLSMMRIGLMQWGPYALKGVGSVSRPSGIYERMMTKLTGHEVIGSIGGNVLEYFRVDIDYPGRHLYLKRIVPDTEAPLDMVGVTLEPSGNGYVIAGVNRKEKNARIGDRLLDIDGNSIEGLTAAEVMDKLAGKSGTLHSLSIERDGQRQNIETTVIKIY